MPDSLSSRKAARVRLPACRAADLVVRQLVLAFTTARRSAADCASADTAGGNPIEWPRLKENSLRRKTRTALNFSPEHAAHALHALIADGRIAASDVGAALKRREAMIRELRDNLAALERGELKRFEKAGRKAARRVKRKGKRKMSAARRAALKLHGRYIGSVRTLPKAAKARLKAIRERAGVHAAIKAARKMAKQAAPGANPQRGGVQGTLPDYQSPQQRKLAAYQQRERPKPDKHGGSGAGRQQGGSGAGRERG